MKFDMGPPLIEPANTPEKRIVCVAWASDGERLAVTTADRFVCLVMATSGENSRCPIKARDDQSPRNFTITGLSWAPDSMRFAIAQSGCSLRRWPRELARRPQGNCPSVWS
jgi:dipeptidyl aminopeptidase/acylaminoacyl peptidase